MKNRFIAVLFLLTVGAFYGCAGRKEVMAANESQVKLRSMQTRAFDTHHKTKTLRAVIATLQDLGFVVDKADAQIGTVTATKVDFYSLRMTVTVRPRGRQMLVRASAQYNAAAVEDPAPYQQFFTALSKSLFLAANEAD